MLYPQMYALGMRFVYAQVRKTMWYTINIVMHIHIILHSIFIAVSRAHSAHDTTANVQSDGGVDVCVCNQLHSQYGGRW